MAETKSSSLSKQALLREGMQQLAQKGYHGTGIKQVLDVVGVPKGSFYNYFNSKQAYVAEIIQLYNDESMAMFDALIEQSNAAAVDQLQLLYRHMLEKYAEENYQKGCLVGSLAAEIGHHSALCQAAMQHAVASWQCRLAGLLRQGQEQGSIRCDIEATQLAETLWAIWEGVLLKAQIDANAESAQRVMTVLFDHLLGPVGR